MSFKYVIGRSGTCIHRVSEDKITAPSFSGHWHDDNSLRFVEIRGKKQYYRANRIYSTFEEARAQAVLWEQEALDKKLKQVAKSKARLAKLQQLTDQDTY